MNGNIIALGLSVGLVWAVAILMVAGANLFWPGYGRAFLDVVASVYPGYHPGTGIVSVMIGTLYGLVDAAIAGAVLGVIYNWLSRRFRRGAA